MVFFSFEITGSFHVESVRQDLIDLLYFTFPAVLLRAPASRRRVATLFCVQRGI